MPGFDGTGPLGQGPMTGRGLGYCILKISDEQSPSIQSFVGLDGKPFLLYGNERREVTEMPAGDRTGPAGLGPMTGRAAGYCAGYPVPGFMNPIPGQAGFYGAPYIGGPYASAGGPYPYGASMPYGAYPRFGWGFGRGWGRGFGRGWGRGFGRGWGRGFGRGFF